MSVGIAAVPCRTDNYAYTIFDEASGEVWVVDPSSGEPVRQALLALGGCLRGILLTHHHQDHVEGVESLLDWAGEARPWVAAHAHDRGRIAGQSVFIAAGRGRFTDSGLRIAGIAVEAMHVPGHTLGAIAWKLGEEVFTGDTLFAGGCGRLFEGSVEQLWESLQALVAGPPARRLWFGHEYTAANLRFARHERPDDHHIAHRFDALTVPSTPTTIELEQATNLFVQTRNADELAHLRARKDLFRD